jgi:hypothetical protein
LFLQAEAAAAETTAATPTSAKAATNSVFDRLDTAQFSWFHVKAILISGVG